MAQKIICPVFWSIKSHTKWVMFGGWQGKEEGLIFIEMARAMSTFCRTQNRNSACKPGAAEFEPAAVYFKFISNSPGVLQTLGGCFALFLNWEGVILQ